MSVPDGSQPPSSLSAELPASQLSQEGSRFQRFFTQPSPSSSPNQPRRATPAVSAQAARLQPDMCSDTDENVVRMMHKLAGSGGSMLVSDVATSTSRQPFAATGQMKSAGIRPVPIELAPTPPGAPFAVDPPRPFLATETFGSSQPRPAESRRGGVRHPLAAQFGMPPAKSASSSRPAHLSTAAGSGQGPDSAVFNRLKQMVGGAQLPPMPTPTVSLCLLRGRAGKEDDSFRCSCLPQIARNR